jgi:hypothetical protein
MSLPFTTEQFFEVFARYNTAIRPMQVVLLVLALVAAPLAATRRGWRAAAFIVAALWAWMAVAYHAAFFTAINPAAYFFAMMFVVEAALVARWAMDRSQDFVRPSTMQIAIAAVVFLYALVAYPAIGYLIGERYPAVPTFGVPCPTTIFTFGIFAMLASSLPPSLLAIPIVWAFFGAFAALRLGVPQDLGLLVATLASLISTPALKPLQRGTV